MPCYMRYEVVTLNLPWTQAEQAAKALGWRYLGDDRYAALPDEVVRLVRDGESAALRWPVAYEASAVQARRALLAQVVRQQAAKYGWKTKPTPNGLVLYR